MDILNLKDKLHESIDVHRKAVQCELDDLTAELEMIRHKIAIKTAYLQGLDAAETVMDCSLNTLKEGEYDSSMDSSECNNCYPDRD